MYIKPKSILQSLEVTNTYEICLKERTQRIPKTWRVVKLSNLLIT